MIKFLAVQICLFPLFMMGQQLVPLTPLNYNVRETSGLIYLNGKLITHNDSGGESALYELDTITGNVIRRVVISNATNVDWEDICMDNSYIYIGDFGNNYGNRSNLKIYKILISDYLNTPNDSVYADIINFNYANQVNFSSALNANNFDAEALISYQDSLYIFTKNWLNFNTNIYALPKIVGNYQITQIDSITSLGLVTGATYDSATSTIMLTGYTNTPFVVEINQFVANHFSQGNIVRTILPINGSIQIEGICQINYHQYYISSEFRSPDAAFLYRLDMPVSTTSAKELKNNSINIYPNPCTNLLTINNHHHLKTKIYNSNGILEIVSHDKEIDTSKLAKGVYFVKFIGDTFAEIKRFVKL